jgi:hypothetical protein
MNRACPRPLDSDRNCPPRQRSRFAVALVGALALSTVAAPTHAQEVPAAIPAGAPTDSSIAGVPAAPAPPRVVMQNQSGALSIIVLPDPAAPAPRGYDPALEEMAWPRIGTPGMPRGDIGQAQYR